MTHGSRPSAFVAMWPDSFSALFDESRLAPQLFIAISALTSLLLAAVTAERTNAARALAASEASQRALAAEQAALRRVATLVASKATPSRVFEQVTKEVALLLGLPSASVVRFDEARTATVVGEWSEQGTPSVPVSSRVDVDGDSASAHHFAIEQIRGSRLQLA